MEERGADFNVKRVARRALSVVLSLALVAGGCSRDLTTSGELSRLAREEIQVGERIDQTIRSQFYVYTEPGVNAYVTQVGEKVLAARAPAPRKASRPAAGAAAGDEAVSDIQSRLRARETRQPRFCWNCRKSLHARTDRCPFCGETQ